MDIRYRLFLMRDLTLLTLVASLSGCKQHPADLLPAEVRKVHPQVAPVIDALTAYQGQHGKYPATLQELRIEVPDIVKNAPAGSFGTGPLRYQAARDGSFARVFYVVADEGDYEKTSTGLYDTRARIWTEVSYINPLPNEEALHFGREYQASQQAASLALAVQSLIDSARNPWHPCRNLWQDRVFESIGTGRPLQPVPDEMLREAGNRVEYSNAGARGTYAFVFEEKIHAPIKKPLTSVTAIYQKESNRWRLAQKCDSSGK
jgi:hypothetical protein